ncbi:four helix bundle protein [Candidatus Gottesmanbacteria bacterium]|nr:four helix bundle protein [Candidatus Gottesmanbacteria bacterium]
MGFTTKNKTIDIHERILNFVVRVLKLLKEIPKTPENLIIINQITRSVTSVGANDREADGASTKKDFIHCYTIVRKELNETDYWLTIIAEVNPRLKSRMNGLLKESKELVKIVSTIVYRAKTH